MSRPTGRLSLALDMQSVTRLWRDNCTKSEGPAAPLRVAVLVVEHRDAGPAGHPHTLLTNEGADMAQSTRGYPRSDSETRTSAVKITPASTVSATVPTTPTIA